MIFLGIGSSIGDAEKIFDSAEKSLEKKGIRVLHKSRILQNPPQGGIAKNEFSNAVWEIETNLLPNKLLEIIQNVEYEHDRVRGETWGDRTLDLDILIFNDQVVATSDLKIPHIEIPNRLFVLLPLLELVDENFEIITFGVIKNLIEKLKNEN